MNIPFNKLVDQEKPILIQDEMDVSHLFKERNEVRSVEPVQVNLQAMWSSGDHSVHVKGICTLHVEFACSRCLNGFKEHLEIPVHEIFSKDEDVVSQDEEERIHFVSGDSIDLIPTLEENLILALPFIPVCKEDCQGLCAICGQNKNEQSCNCKQEEIDPRLAGLKAFFE